ncbi:DUF1206 domain-containing protein [Nonomuraea typhae]|uniref:DUF1206 domain-containing protein n=1 Tax=Nonomuraea typhae TaxID=2603600 RepID=A0ABW7ZB50_9ACTN
MSQAESTVRRAADSTVMDRLARVGLACRGVLYGLIGVLAIQIAMGEGSREADKAGAISVVAQLPFGAALLWIMLAGFVALALWQLSEVFFGGHRALDRVESAGRVVMYALVVVTLWSVLTAKGAGSEDKKSQTLTDTLLELPGGPVIVSAIGLVLIVLGAYSIHRGVTKKFQEELAVGRMSPPARTVMVRLGVAGYAVRGLIAGLAGIFVVLAAVNDDPRQAGGIDRTLRAFADTPAGPWALWAVALGLLLFAGYCFGEARWRRT